MSRVVRIAVVASSLLALGACVPPSPAAPSAGCYDNTVFNDPGDAYADYFYTGARNTAGNMTFHDSSDGTCSGPLQPDFNPQHAESVSSVANIGRLLFTQHAFAFEVTSVLILVAMVGAVVLARKEH